MAIRGQVLRDVWLVTEMRDGAVFKTKHIARVWVWIDIREAKLGVTVDGLTYGSVSNLYDGRTIRSVIVPDD